MTSMKKNGTLKKIVKAFCESDSSNNIMKPKFKSS